MVKFLRWFKSDEYSTPQLQYSNDQVQWSSHTAHPHYGVVGEYKDHDGSKGFRMMQYLLRNGYTMLDQNGEEV